jgi:acyl carrier protein
VAPRTPTEELLAKTWTEVLKLQRVSVYDNFFDIGGHSLKATQVISRVQETFGVDLPLRLLFEAPTIAAFAARLEQRLATDLKLQEIEWHMAEIESLSDEEVKRRLP